MAVIAIRCTECNGYHFAINPYLSDERGDPDSLYMARVVVKCQTCGHVQRVAFFTTPLLKHTILQACRQLGAEL